MATYFGCHFFEKHLDILILIVYNSIVSNQFFQSHSMCRNEASMSIYDLSVLNTIQDSISLEKYRGKVLLIVNTATGCGFTPQYEGLETLYKTYHEKGLEILDFPCNQFLNQAPGSNEEIAQFCQLHYNTTFETFAKIDVNGKNADPLYQFLKDQPFEDQEDEALSSFQKKLASLKQTVTGKNIKWNFTKFLVGRDGTVLGRFAPTVKPEDLVSYIENALAQE